MKSLFLILLLPLLMFCQNRPEDYDSQYSGIVNTALQYLTDAPNNLKYAWSMVFDTLKANGELGFYKGLWIVGDTEGNSPNMMDGTAVTNNGVTFTAYENWTMTEGDNDLDLNFVPEDYNMSHEDFAIHFWESDTSTSAGTGNFSFSIGSLSFFNERNGASNVQWRVHSSDTETFGPPTDLVQNALYSFVRANGTDHTWYIDGVEKHTSAGTSSLDDMDNPVLFGQDFDGAGSGTNAKFSAIAITTADADMALLSQVMTRFNSVAKYSPEAQDALIALGLDDPNQEEWRRETVAWAVDYLQDNDQWRLTEQLNKYGVTTESRALQSWTGGPPSTKVGSPEFIQSLGFKNNDTISAIDTKWIPTRSPEDLTYIWKGRPLSNIFTANYIMGVNDATNSTYLFLDTDTSNWVAQVHQETTKWGMYFDIDTTDFVAIRSKYPNISQVYKSDSLVQQATRTHGGLPTKSLFVGGNNNNDTGINHGSLQIAEWFAVVRGDVNLTVWKRMFNRTDSAWVANAPVGPGDPEEDVTNPTTPTILLDVANDNSLRFDITVASTDANGIVEYEVERDQALDFTISGGATDFTVPGLAVSTGYDIRIRAKDPSGNFSSYSNEPNETTTNSGTLTVTIDFETTPTNPPLRWDHNPVPLLTRLVTDPLDGGNTVSEALMTLPTYPPEGSDELLTSSTARVEYEYKQGVAGSPGRQMIKDHAYGFRFRFMIPDTHDGGVQYYSTFFQNHQPASSCVSGSPPLLIRTHDHDDNQVHDVLFQTYHTTEPCGERIPGNIAPVRNVMAENTWYNFVVDVKDGRGEADGYVKVYMKAGGWPAVGDLIMSYEGPYGFEDGLGNYMQIGQYWASAKNPDRVIIMRGNGYETSHWYHDDITFQDAPFLSAP